MRFPLGLPAALVAFAIAAGCAPPPPAGRASFDPDSIPEAYQGSTAALAWPGAARAFQVRPDGNLFNGEWTVRFDPRAEGRTAAPPRVIAYEERWRPVAHWRRWSGRVRWDFEAVALPAPARGDTGLIVSLELDVTNTASEPLPATLTARLAPPDSAPPFVASDVAEPPVSPRWGLPDDPEPAEGLAFPGDVGSFDGLAFTLAPGATRTLRFVLPAYPTPGRALASWARTSHARRADEARRFWAECLARGARFELNDPETEHALDAARVLLLSCRERRRDPDSRRGAGARWVPIGAPLHYRDVWLRDGARAIAALAVTGHTREARELADGFLLLQWPMGAFMSQRGQLDGTGQALWAFEQAWLRPAPGDSVPRFAEAALRACRWLEWQRALGRETGWRFGAMMPFADPRDNELTVAQMVGSDAWALAGERAAARLLRAARREAEADSVERWRAAYAADFRDALAASGAADVPPSWQGTGRDWGNLSVAWPCGALDPADPRCAALARRVWSAAGGAGLVTYGGPDSLHDYLGADLGTWALLAGRRAEADSVLAAMLRWRSASGGAGEIFSRRGGYGVNLPPHGTSAAALACLIRNALLFDDGDSLRLTLGARERWWTGARVRGAPTRWGVLDLEFRRLGDEAEWRWTAVPVWTVLTLPPGTRRAAEPDAPLRAGSTEAQVLAPPGTNHARVRVAGAPS